MTTPAKGPGGRPSSYKPEYCEQIIELMAEGYSVAGAAGKIGVARTTIYRWAEANEEFRNALTHAQAASAAWWEDRARHIAVDKDAGNAAVIIFALKNRVADEWRDVNRQEISGPDGGPIQTEETTARDEIARKLSSLAARSGAGENTIEPE